MAVGGPWPPPPHPGPSTLQGVGWGINTSKAFGIGVGAVLEGEPGLGTRSAPLGRSSSGWLGIWDSTASWRFSLWGPETRFLGGWHTPTARYMCSVCTGPHGLRHCACTHIKDTHTTCTGRVTHARLTHSLTQHICNYTQMLTQYTVARTHCINITHYNDTHVPTTQPHACT